MEKIENLKKIFKNYQINGYLIPKNDEFFTEYVSNHNDRLNFISNFSGSSGLSLILSNKNYLFVDGRYTLQAKKESGRIFSILTVPKKTPNDILKNKKVTIGFDPKLFTKRTISFLFKKNKCKFKPIYKNLIDEIWKRKIKRNKNQFYILPKNSSCRNYRLKINNISLHLKKMGADFLFITASENNAWLLNIRGHDSKYSPIPHSYIILDRFKNIKVFCDLNKIPAIFKKYFKNIQFYKTELVEKFLAEIKNKNFILDKNTCSVHFENIISQHNQISSYDDPIYNFKAIKNIKEINKIKAAHIYDGAALTKYLFWLKKNFNKIRITEISASEKLLKFRKKNKNFKFLSFPTISGTGPNGAIIHYNASPKTNRVLKKGDIYLVDSGGQYEFGTTDVTRTISLNNSDKKIRDIFTRVLKGHIAVTNFKLDRNVSGDKIDIAARKYLKQIGLNYSHGTGHGVGYYLNVHEGPHAISKNNKVYFQEGMVVSNEPGYYKKNEFGIRIENLIYVKKNKNKKFFDNLTMAPIEKELINKNLLNKDEKNWLNQYHKNVFKNLKNLMNKSEIEELREACSAI